MKKKTLIKPTDAELQILQILWRHGPSTVRFINDQLNKHKPVGYTTTLKIMQLMLEKKILSRNDDQRSHTYTAIIGEGDTQKVLVDRLLQTAFGGSAMKLVLQALGDHKASKEEVDQIRDFLSHIEGEKK